MFLLFATLARLADGHAAVTQPRPRNAIDAVLTPWSEGVRIARCTALCHVVAVIVAAVISCVPQKLSHGRPTTFYPACPADPSTRGVLVAQLTYVSSVAP